MEENENRNIRQELIEILEEYVENNYSQHKDSRPFPWDTEYADEYNAFVSSQPELPPQHLRIISNGVALNCPLCYRVVVSSKGLTVPAYDFFQQNIDKGMPKEDVDFIRDYYDDVCVFLLHCQHCGHSWKIVEPYDTFEEGAWKIKLINDFWKQKGLEPSGIEDSMEERGIDDLAREALEKWKVQ